MENLTRKQLIEEANRLGTLYLETRVEFAIASKPKTWLKAYVIRLLEAVSLKAEARAIKAKYTDNQWLAITIFGGSPSEQSDHAKVNELLNLADRLW